MVRVLAERAGVPEWPKASRSRSSKTNPSRLKPCSVIWKNNVVTAIVLVMIVIILAMGWRPSLLVGLSIPGSFGCDGDSAGAGFHAEYRGAVRLILVVGMLVDGAIVTVELAERRLAAGETDPREAFSGGIKRMTWPIIASTATALMVFMPLTVWPGIVGGS